VKLRPIEWKKYDEAEIGYVGGVKRFVITYSFNTPPWRLVTMIGIAPKFGTSEDEVKKLAQALLQKHVSSLVE
jgi:hypothetical protein